MSPLFNLEAMRTPLGLEAESTPSTLTTNPPPSDLEAAAAPSSEAQPAPCYPLNTTFHHLAVASTAMARRPTATTVGVSDPEIVPIANIMNHVIAATATTMSPSSLRGILAVAVAFMDGFPAVGMRMTRIFRRAMAGKSLKSLEAMALGVDLGGVGGRGVWRTALGL